MPSRPSARRSPSPAQRRRQAIFTVIAMVVIVIVVGITWGLNHSAGSERHSTDRATSVSSDESPGSVPSRVTHTLSLIDAGDWPEAAHAPGTHGGTTFRNNEGHLPARSAHGTKVSYKEWDVNAKKPGHGRDAERIITGSDGSAWYTADHYETFTKIRGGGK